jgi:hypothetical protein
MLELPALLLAARSDMAIDYSRAAPQQEYNVF